MFLYFLIKWRFVIIFEVFLGSDEQYFLRKSNEVHFGVGPEV